MCNIDEIMSMMDWNNSEEVQQKGIQLANQIKNLNVFFQPYKPSIMENCAKILVNKPDGTLKPHLSELLEWLRDMNWPGAETILERLKAFDEIDMVVSNVECCVKKAIAYGTFDELKFLDNLSELLENEKLKAALPTETLEILQKHYYNRGWWDEE